MTKFAATRKGGMDRISGITPRGIADGKGRNPPASSPIRQRSASSGENVFIEGGMAKVTTSGVLEPIPVVPCGLGL